MKNTQIAGMIFIGVMTFYNIRTMYINQNEPPVKKFFKELTLGRDTVIENYWVVNNKDTALINDVNSERYPFLSERRNIVFDENLDGNSIRIWWNIWFDGQIIESSNVPPHTPLGQVGQEREKLKKYASNRIKLYSEIKR